MSSMDTSHAPFPPSQPSWEKYSDEQIIEHLKNQHKAELGTEIHEWSSIQILLSCKISNVRDAIKSIKTYIYKNHEREPERRDMLLRHLTYIPKDSFVSVKDFVNDSIGYGMESELRVESSDYCFGTSDAIKYFPKENLLRVFDLKTGTRPAKIEQVFIYAALYCLENRINPLNTNFDTRIYQNAEVIIEEPQGDDIAWHAERILHINEVCAKFEGGKINA